MVNNNVRLFLCCYSQVVQLYLINSIEQWHLPGLARSSWVIMAINIIAMVIWRSMAKIMLTTRSEVIQTVNHWISISSCLAGCLLLKLSLLIFQHHRNARLVQLHLNSEISVFRKCHECVQLAMDKINSIVMSLQLELCGLVVYRLWLLILNSGCFIKIDNSDQPRT